MKSEQPDRPILRLTNGGGEQSPSSADAPFLATRLGVLTHELASLLDGSMRCLGLVRRSITSQGAASQGQASIEAQLQTVQQALERMAGLVQNAMHGAGQPGAQGGATLGEAVEHAMAVLAPLACEQRARTSRDIAPETRDVDAGPLYAVILNALRNAIESVGLVSEGGAVHVSIAPSQQEKGMLELTISDTGPGLAPAVDAGRAFIIGMTTKPSGQGIGLCLAAQIMGQLGGRISLTNGDGSSGHQGAVFSACWPVARTDASIG